MRLGHLQSWLQKARNRLKIHWKIHFEVAQLLLRHQKHTATVCKRRPWQSSHIPPTAETSSGPASSAVPTPNMWCFYNAFYQQRFPSSLWLEHIIETVPNYLLVHEKADTPSQSLPERQLTQGSSLKATCASPEEASPQTKGFGLFSPLGNPLSIPLQSDLLVKTNTLNNYKIYNMVFPCVSVLEEAIRELSRSWMLTLPRWGPFSPRASW